MFSCLIYRTYGILAQFRPSDPGVLSALYPWVWMILIPFLWARSLPSLPLCQAGSHTVLSGCWMEFGTEQWRVWRCGAAGGHQSGGLGPRSGSISPSLAGQPWPSHFPFWTPVFPLALPTLGGDWSPAKMVKHAKSGIDSPALSGVF